MAKASKKLSVLVVDDDDEWLDLAKAALGESFTVHTAQGGNEGVDAALALKPALVIMDVMMPGSTDGFSAFCQIRNNPETKDIPVIMFTQVNQISGLAFGEDNMNEYLGSKPTAFLEKPVSPARLLKEVNAALGVSA